MTNNIRSSLASAGDSSPDSTDSDGVRCWIAFGGNVGDVHRTFDAALTLLAQHDKIQLGQRSGLYDTSPMGSGAGHSFLNSICSLTTQLTPQDLLRLLKRVENQLGRVRDVRWGPRTLDVDLLAHGSHIVDEPDLVIPHPALTYRRFVLDPLVEVDPDWCHPVFSVSARELITRLNRRPLRASLLAISHQDIEDLEQKLTPKFPDLQFVSDRELSEDVLPIQTTTLPLPIICQGAIVDLRRSPGDLLEKLTSAFTSMFDAPKRISDW